MSISRCRTTFLVSLLFFFVGFSGTIEWRHFIHMYLQIRSYPPNDLNTYLISHFSHFTVCAVICCDAVAKRNRLKGLERGVTKKQGGSKGFGVWVINIW